MTPMRELMARSAHARARRFYANMPPWEQMPKGAKEQGMAMADAMLEALLKPTDEILSAGGRHVVGTSTTTKQPVPLGVGEAEEIFVLMIRAALEGK